MKKLTGIILVLSAFLAACGPTAVPTMNPLDVQNTAVAAAWTVVAMTQNSIPTATPIPPTDIPSPTPFPTFTPLPLPTLNIPTQSGINSQPSSNPSSGGPTPDPCNAPMAGDAAGPKVSIHFENDSNGSVVMSLYLTKKTVFGECGYYALNMKKSDSPTVDVLLGCYWAGAFITGNKASKAFGNFCVTTPHTKYTVRITSEVIYLIGQ